MYSPYLASFLMLVLLMSASAKLWGLRPISRHKHLAKYPVRSDASAAVLALGLTITEVVSASLLLLSTPVGTLLTLSILIAYTAYQVRLPSSEDCACFNGAFEFGGSKRARLVRNAVLIGISMALLVATARESSISIQASHLTVSLMLLLILRALDKFISVGTGSLGVRVAAEPSRVLD